MEGIQDRPLPQGPYAPGTPPGALLRGWRERALLTQERLAERAGLNVRTIRRLENGALRRPRPSSILLLADALRLDGEERAVLAAAALGRTAAPPVRGDRAGTVRPAAADVPRELPADAVPFTGREAESAAIEIHGSSGAPVVIAVEGMAGAGKTALAVRAARRLAPRFPDGQVFVDLRGHRPGRAPVHPGEALARVLGALGVPAQRVPEHIDDRAALYRGAVADRRILVVLDDAACEEQVRPLLPAGPGCRLIVTSRRRLTGLDDVRAVPLDVLPVDHAIALFTATAGHDRVAGTPADVLAETVRRCGLLPLAVRTAAARLRARPAWTVEHLLARLNHARPTELDAGERGVYAALDLSYQRLPDDQRRAYRLLGSRAAEFGAEDAASVLGTTAPQARRLLDRLLDVHLLQEPAPGRYRFHDLVADHAAAS